MSLKLNHKILLLVAIPLAFVLVVIGVFALIQNETVSAAIAGERSDNVLAQAGILWQAVDDADDNKREYLLTNNPIFADRCRASIARVDPLVAALANLVSDNPDGEKAISQLDFAVDVQIRNISDVLRSKAAGRLSQSEMNSALFAGNRLKDDTRKVLQAFTSEEDRVQHERDAALFRSFEFSRRLMIAAGVAAFGLTITIMIIFSRVLIKRIQDLGTRAQRFANGEPIGIIELVPADDEIGVADQAFRQMATLLAERQAALTRYRLLSEAARDIIFFIRRSDFRILEANDAAVRAYGYSRAELLQLTIRDIRSPEGVLQLDEHVRQTDLGPVLFETTHRRKDGSIFPVEVAGQSAVIGGERMLLSINRDLTDRLRLETERAMFFDASPDMMCSASFDGYLVKLNPVWERALGFSLAELRAKPFMEFIHPDDQASTTALVVELMAGYNTVAFECRLLRKDGGYTWFSWSAQSALDEQLMYAVGHDITQQKQIDADLAKSRDEAMEATRVKSQFLANMSHEIRTPMNGIIGTTELLNATRLDAEQREYTDLIKVSGSALLAVVNQILDVSKLEAGKVTLDSVEFSPASVIESVAVLFAPQAHDKDIAIQSNVSASIPPLLRGDVGRLRQVLLNITGNAVKFTEHGRVDIHASAASSDATSVILGFTISDSGIGLSREAQTLLFEPFTQADMTTSRKYGGTGLGLSISKRLVELMGGQIGVESTEGRGSTFWFTARFDRCGDVHTPSPYDNLTGLRALILDPDSLSRELLHQYMAAWGMRCGDGAAATDEGIDALRRAAAEGDPIQVVIVADSVAFGGEFARLVSEDLELSHTKMILLSPIGAQQRRDDSAGSLFAAYLSKPIRQSYLFDSVTAALNKQTVFDATHASEIEILAKIEPADLVFHVDHRILLAEDNVINRRLAVAQFKKLGIEADLAVNGREAVAAAARRTYDLVLMDCQMPEMDGFAATRAIRRTEEKTGLHVPIIAMTANAMHGDRESCVARGMDDYLAKPVEMDQLRAMLARWIPTAREPGRRKEPND